MKIQACALLISCFFLSILSPESVEGQEWEKTFGGTNAENGTAVLQASDGGFIVVGSTTSFGAGSWDVYAVKTDANGDTLWTKTYGGPSGENGQSVRQTYDGGFIIGGLTVAAGTYNIYLIKTDANGNALWTKTIGPGTTSYCSDIIQTSDSGFCIAGIKGSVADGGSDVYLVRTDKNGDTLWTNTYGRSILDLGYSLKQTTDNGFIIAAAAYNESANYYEAYVVRTDASGDTLWTKIFHNGYNSFGQSVCLAADGGYFMGGISNEHFYAVKMDANGATQWARELDEGRCYSTLQASDGGYVMAGYANLASPDVVVLKIDNNGNKVWSKKYGGNQSDEGWAIQPVQNGGFIIAGTSHSDIYLVKTACDNFPAAGIAIVDTLCQGNLMASTLLTTPQNGAAYQWTKNDTIIPGAAMPAFISSGDGSYALTITDSIGCSNESNAINIYFPSPYFQVSPPEVCPGDEVLMGSWNFGQLYYSSFDWDFGDGSGDTGLTAQHVYIDTGTYTVTRTVRTANGSCNSYQDSIVISSTAIPPVDFDILINSHNMIYNVACPGDRIEFIPYAYSYLFVQLPFFEAAAYLWDFGDGTTDTVPFPVHYYSQFGTYPLTLTVTNHCGNSASITSSILIDSSAAVFANFSWTDSQGVVYDTVNACEQIIFHSVSALTYDWNFGDGNSVTTSSDTVLHAFTSSGDYQVRLIAANGCGYTDTVVSTVTVSGTCSGIFTPSSGETLVILYPSPFSRFATLQIVPSARHASLQRFDLLIYDFQGREVKRFSFEQLKFVMDTGELQAGIYFYKLSSGNEILAIERFIIR
jgi:PKD repeat protein